MDQGLLKTEHSLAEARVIFELAQRGSWERLELRERLGMDASFLTRVVGRLEDKGLVASTRSAKDGRALDLTLTDAGREAFEILNSRSAEQIEELLNPLPPEQRAMLVEAMTVISHLVGPGHEQCEITLRTSSPGTSAGWSAGMEKMMLWTNDVLVLARRIYEAVGFELVEEEEHHSFGHDLVGQNWALDLTG